MECKISENKFIQSVYEINLDNASRDLNRYKYKFAERFWSLILLAYNQDKLHFENNFQIILLLHAELFFHVLEEYFGCVEKFDQLDREYINSYRGDKKAIQSFVLDQREIARQLEITMDSILDRDLKNPTKLNVVFEVNPQPYLPTCEQVLKKLSGIFNIKLTNDMFVWPYEKLSKSDIKKLQNFAKELFLSTIFKELSASMQEFDASGKMTYSAYDQAHSEVDAVNDYITKFDNFLGLNNEQIGFRIYTKYRDLKGVTLNPQTINRNINRYFGKK